MTPRKALLAIDRLVADIFGWSGDYTISAEWGRRSCVICRIGCRLLEYLDVYHCYKAAKAAGFEPAEHVKRPE